MIDDFGTDYSNLLLRLRLPIRHFKINGSFVRKLPAGLIAGPYFFWDSIAGHGSSSIDGAFDINSGWC